MKSFDTLYKRTRTGAIQFWKIEVIDGILIGDKTSDGRITDQQGGSGTIVKTSGQLNTTSPVVHKEVISEGKNIGKANETTPLQQSTLQAESDWRRKKDEGYKSLIDLGYDVIGARSNESQSSEHLRLILEKLLPKFNTDQNGNIKPMLAQDWKGGKKVKYPCLIQPKLDGVRCLLISDEAGIVFLSRSGKDYSTLEHISDHLLFYRSHQGIYPFILDGEIYSEELTFQETVQATKKICANSKKLKLRVYDMVSDNCQEQRLETLKDIVVRINSPHIQLVETCIAHDQVSVKRFHDQWVSQGYEGAMLRFPQAVYDQGQRSSSLLKVKEFDETEFDLIGLEQGQRGVEDLLAVCNSEAGQFTAKIQGNKRDKEGIWNWYVNQVTEGLTVRITIKHFGFTDEGLPRFPIGKGIRGDE